MPVASPVPTGRNLRSLQRQRSRHSIERRSLRTAGTKWRPAQPASVKLCATGLQRPRVLTLIIELMSACGRYCCKSRKSNNPKNLAKVDLWTFLLLRRFSALLRRSVSGLDETIWSLTSPRVNRISGSKNFRSTPQKDFFNTIGTFETCRRLPRMSVYWGTPEVTGEPRELRD